MLKLIEGLPKYVLGVEARGNITDKDYRKVLIPAADKRLAKEPYIRLLFVAGKDFKGYDARAMWDDAVFGLNHWSCFSCAVVVTDVVWLRNAVHLFSPFFPGVVKTFPLAKLEAAKKWVSEDKLAVHGKKAAGKKKPAAKKKAAAKKKPSRRK